jgi:hypothetical protein
MANRPMATDSQDLARLRHRFHGRVLLPDHRGYHQARRVWNAMVDRRPAVIARCTGPADVAAVVRFGRALGLEMGCAVELADMPEGERAQPRPHGGGGHHPMAKHRLGGPAAQQLHVVDAVPTGDHGVDQGEQLASGTGRAWLVPQVDQLVGGPCSSSGRSSVGCCSPSSPTCFSTCSSASWRSTSSTRWARRRRRVSPAPSGPEPASSALEP